MQTVPTQSNLVHSTHKMITTYIHTSLDKKANFTDPNKEMFSPTLQTNKDRHQTQASYKMSLHSIIDTILNKMCVQFFCYCIHI